MSDAYAAGTFVTSRDGNETGVLTGGSFLCQLEGCTGKRLTTRWPDGKLTHPCTKGMTYTRKDGWRIE